MLRSRKPAIITGLLYPGLLGSLLYEAVPKVFGSGPGGLPSETIVLVLALLWHYVLDYIYTYDRTPDAPYDWLMFIADALIVVCLYFAIRYAYSHDTALAWLFMLGTKLAAFMWELADARHAGFDQAKDRALGSDWLFCWPYLLGLFFFPDQPLALAAVLVADASVYIWLSRRPQTSG